MQLHAKDSWSILDQRFLCEKYGSVFEEGEGEEALDSQEDLFNQIVSVQGKDLLNFKYSYFEDSTPSILSTLVCLKIILFL